MLGLWGAFCWCSHGDEASALPLILLGASSVGWSLALWRRWSLGGYGLLAFFVLSRLFALFSEPFLEDDHYRYLWDGIVTERGASALEVSPLEVMIGEPRSPRPMEAVQWRRSMMPEQDLEDLLLKVNHPESPSIYGPVAQAFLGAQTHLLERIVHEPSLEQRIMGLKLALLVLDALLCLAFVRQVGMGSLATAMVTSPLMLKEVGNSLHIDVLTVLLSFWAWQAMGRPWVRWLGLLLASGVKPYLLVLGPFHRRVPWMGMVLMVLGLALLWAPWLWVSGSEALAGTRYFASLWTMNDFIPALLRSLMLEVWGSAGRGIDIFPIGDIYIHQALSWSKLVCLGFYILFLYDMWRRRPHPDNPALWGWVLLGLWCFSPVQNPWYLLWSFPFLLLGKVKSARVLWCCFPAYYLNFHLGPTAHLFAPFQWWVVLPHLLFLGELTLEGIRCFDRPRPKLVE